MERYNFPSIEMAILPGGSSAARGAHARAGGAERCPGKWRTYRRDVCGASG